MATAPGQLLVWDWNRLLRFNVDETSNVLAFQSDFPTREPNIGRLLTVGNRHFAIHQARLFVNNPDRDRLEVFDLGPEGVRSHLEGGDTGLCQAMAIAAGPANLYVLDSEGARIVALTLAGAPKKRYLLAPEIRQKGILALAANASALFCAAGDGIYSTDFSKL